MAPILFVVAAAVGTAVRYGTGASLNSPSWPTGTMLVNLLGAFALGWAVGADSSQLVIIGVAGLGSVTTFSTAAFEALRLADSNRNGAALAYVGVTVAGGIAAAWIGLTIGAAV